MKKNPFTVGAYGTDAIAALAAASGQQVCPLDLTLRFETEEEARAAYEQAVPAFQAACAQKADGEVCWQALNLRHTEGGTLAQTKGKGRPDHSSPINRDTARRWGT